MMNPGGGGDSLDVGSALDLLRRLRAETAELDARRDALVRANALAAREADLAAEALGGARAELQAALRKVQIEEERASEAQSALETARAAEQATALTLEGLRRLAQEADERGRREESEAGQRLLAAFDAAKPAARMLVDQLKEVNLGEAGQAEVPPRDDEDEDEDDDRVEAEARAEEAALEALAGEKAELERRLAEGEEKRKRLAAEAEGARAELEELRKTRKEAERRVTFKEPGAAAAN